MRAGKDKINFTLLNVGQANHDGDWNFKDIKSPFARIHYILEGNAFIVLNDQQIFLRPGYLYLTPSHIHHSYECKEQLSLYYIHIYEDPEVRSSIFDRYAFPKEIKADSLILQLIERLLFINPGRELPIFDPKSYDNSTELKKNIEVQTNLPFAIESESQSIIHFLMSRFLAEASSKNINFEKRLIIVLDYIDDNIHQSISIDELAELTFVSKDHLIRLFKKHMNNTPVKYINQKKIEKAQLMILIDGGSIQEICFKLGFEHISYFNRLFKKMTGETPTSYKQRIQKLSSNSSPR